MSFKTPRVLATGHGSAGSGTHHWWMQRVTAVALIPLTVFAIFPFAGALGQDIADVYLVYTNPFNAIVAILFLATMFYHLKLGLQVVIEDYVPGAGWRMGLLLANSLLCAGLGFAGIFAVLKIAFAI